MINEQKEEFIAFHKMRRVNFVEFDHNIDTMLGEDYPEEDRKRLIKMCYKETLGSCCLWNNKKINEPGYTRLYTRHRILLIQLAYG